MITGAGLVRFWLGTTMMTLASVIAFGAVPSRIRHPLPWFVAAAVAVAIVLLCALVRASRARFWPDAVAGWPEWTEYPARAGLSGLVLYGFGEATVYADPQHTTALRVIFGLQIVGMGLVFSLGDYPRVRRVSRRSAAGGEIDGADGGESDPDGSLAVARDNHYTRRAAHRIGVVSALTAALLTASLFGGVLAPPTIVTALGTYSLMCAFVIVTMRSVPTARPHSVAALSVILLGGTTAVVFLAEWNVPQPDWLFALMVIASVLAPHGLFRLITATLDQATSDYTVALVASLVGLLVAAGGVYMLIAGAHASGWVALLAGHALGYVVGVVSGALLAERARS